MKALILAGGHGTRLHPLTLRTPKCLLPIAGKPNMLHLIETLNKSDINEIYVSINDKQLKINDFLNQRRVNIIIENQEKGKLGSIGGLKYALNKIGTNDELIVLGADNFWKGLKLKEFAKTINNTATIALYELPHKHMVEQFGIAEIKNGQITSFQEKPSVEEAKSRLGSTLIYGLSSDWLKNKLPEYIKNNKNLDTIGSMWQYFCKKDELNGHVFKGLWADIGTPRAYIELNNQVMNKMKESIIHESVVIGENTKIKDKVIIEEGCVIGRNCVIGSGTHIMHDTTIGEGSIIEGSVLFENVHVGRQTRIKNSVIDGYSIIKNKVKIDDYSVIGYKSVIEDKSHLIRESNVWPFITASGVINGNITYIQDQNELKRSKYWNG